MYGIMVPQYGLGGYRGYTRVYEGISGLHRVQVSILDPGP